MRRNRVLVRDGDDRVRGLVLGAAVLCRMAMSVTDAGGVEPNYDEGAVRPYSLPDVLAGPDGKPVATADGWRLVARPHQFAVLERFVYGRRLPARPVSVVGGVERTDVTLAGVPATRLQATLRLGDGQQARETDVLVYLPRPSAQGRVPVFLALNFHGNQAEDPDPTVRLCRSYVLNDPAAGIIANRATEKSRGADQRRWPLAAMLGRGFGMATACCGDIFPDHAAGRAESVLPSLGRPVTGDLPADEPGAVGAWAWGLSRILDWLVTLPEVDPARVAVVGHSRLGKAALWAGACDERFAVVISNESGCGGAALSRRNYGETVEVITRRFPHWFCPAFAGYADREAELPCDQHTLLAMTAPRPLYVASAVEDRWADPRGEFLAAVAAEPVWKLFGLVGLGTSEMPAVDQPIGRTIGYHVRAGKHDLLEYDWLRYADFVSSHGGPAQAAR